MTISIMHCFHCQTYLGSKTDETDDNFFYCNSECHALYDAALKERLLEKQETHEDAYKGKKKFGMGVIIDSPSKQKSESIIDDGTVFVDTVAKTTKKVKKDKLLAKP